jgi:hypothetical protein
MSKHSLITELIEEANRDPSLLGLLDVDKLLTSLETAKNEFLENETAESILADVVQALESLPLSKKILTEYSKKLLGYRLVDDLHLLHKGKHVRWIRNQAPYSLTLGGIVVDIQFENTGTNILCRLFNGKYIKYRFNDCITFQKLNGEETLILMLQDIE